MDRCYGGSQDDASMRLTLSEHVPSSMPAYVVPKITLPPEQRPRSRQAQAYRNQAQKAQQFRNLNQQTNRPKVRNQPRQAGFRNLLAMAFLVQIVQMANRRRVSPWRRSWYR